MTTTRAPFALIAASALLLLAGCSGGGTSSTEAESSAPAPSAPAASTPASAAAESDQSKADACQIIIGSFTDVSTTSQSIDTSDPEGTLTTFKELTDKVQSDFAQITNEEIAPAAQKASAQLNQYYAFLESIAADPSKASDLGTQVTALQESFTEAGTACQG